MGKSTKKKNKKVTAPKANIQELSISRDGGQIALRGYSYQFLYSCYLILSSSNPSNFFQLEGIEDIDCIMQKNGSNDITHIQLKYSVNKQDASFLTDVLKNFLEAYLLDQNRFFKLVYDFPVAKGHLSKIFASKLDEKSRTYWAGVISNIKKNNPSWNWSVYDFDKFISHLSFEKIEKSILATEIEKTLIRIYEINTDNVSLFANSIKILCFEKMEQRAYVTKAELDSKIQSVKIDISKGPQNPAHSWIRKLDYSKPSIDEGCSFYEGKKATPADIVSGFPIKRPSLEKDVINSICENMVTVIKASSGQGKTTLALRAAYILQNEYIPYQLLWCDEIKEIGNILELNISCPNVEEGGLSFGTDPHIVERIVGAVRHYAKQPLIVKLSPEVSDITEIAKAAVSGGADAISLINTLRGMKIDIHKRKPVLANRIGGYSGPGIMPVALRMVYEVCHSVDAPVIGMGGISTYEDALEFIMAGAKAVAVGTANFHNPYATVEIIDGIWRYMKENKIFSLEEIRGCID